MSVQGRMTRGIFNHGETSKNSKAIIFMLLSIGCGTLIVNIRLVPHADIFLDFLDLPTVKTKSSRRIVSLLGQKNGIDVRSDRTKTVPALSTWVENSTLTSEEEALYENPNESFETEKCKAMKKWQLQSFPVCNSMHELDLSLIPGQKLPKSGGNQALLWKYTDQTTNTTAALRFMKDQYDYTMDKFEEWRIDNLVLERLTFSPNVMDIYGWCGTAGLYEFSDRPSLGKQIRWQRTRGEGGYPADIDTTQLLRVAVDVSRGVADLHSFDGDYATVGHGDMAYHQFIYVNGVYKLIDFNDGFLQRWDPESKTICNSTKTSAFHRSLSPEEYQYRVRTDKSDVFSFGGVLYSILTGWESFEIEEERDGLDKADKEVFGKLLIKGARPTIPEEFLKSEDPVHIALIKAMKSCWENEPEKRPAVKEIADDLAKVLKDVEKERNSTDGQRWVGIKYCWGKGPKECGRKVQK